MSKILDFLHAILLVFVIVFVGFGIYWFYESMFWKPYDDASNHLYNKTHMWESIDCKGNSCNITFDSNVTSWHPIAMTGSMTPVVNGRDIVVCLDSKPKLGEIVSTDNILHMVYSVEDGWVVTRGISNDWSDNFKFPLDQIDCTVGLVIR